MASRYYHVAGTEYRAGEDLWCYDELEAQGSAPVWKWGEDNAGLDTDVVCLFVNRDEADAFLAEFMPDGQLLVVDLPADYEAWGLRMTKVREGYPAIYRCIPTQFIRHI